MSGPDPAVAQVRGAVRELLRRPECAATLASGEVWVAVSGGADSLALTAAAAHVGPRLGVRVRALVVDHGLQDDSDEVARTAARQAEQLGVSEATVLRTTVRGGGGPEAAARRARYATLRDQLPDADALVLLGHTRDDQAETVLLGMGRGSGPRSLAGMRSLDPPWARPLLEVPRSCTRAACEALGVRPWDDPHNVDPGFTRVRLRSEALPLLEDVLSGGVSAALARTAAQLREDCDVLDELAENLLRRAETAAGTLDAAVLGDAPAALRRRVLRRWLLVSGVVELSDAHLRSVDALIGQWRGQGAVWLPGGYAAARARGTLCVLPPE